MNISKQYIKLLFFFVPAIVGFWGFLQLDGISVSWALYYTVRLFALEMDVSEINGFIEFARWTAPLATVSALLVIFQSLGENFKNYLRSFKKDSCSVYGTGQDAKYLLKSLGKNGVRGNSDKIRKTPFHVVMFDEEQSVLDFYSQHERELAPYRIYLSLDKIPSLSIHRDNVYAFSLEENCAAMFWQSYPANPKEKIAMIGNSSLTDALLTRGLLLNILSSDQHIQYHIWETEDVYPLVHHELSSITMDEIIFHNKPCHYDFEMLSAMDRIILCGSDEENVILAGRLSAYLICPPIYVRMRNQSCIDTFYGYENMIPFGTAEELLTSDLIIKEKLLDTAKQLHEHYREKYPQLPPWEELETFKRQSSLSSAEYFPVVRRLYEKGVERETLAELEHIRWCRFHYLNNWKYGAVRHDAKRIHPCLIPYCQLSEPEKQKDRENVNLALSELI